MIVPENTVSAWNLWGNSTVQVNFSGEFKDLDVPEMEKDTD